VREGHPAGREERPIDLFVLGGRGYVAGELLRLLVGHPGFRLVTASGRSEAGAPIDAAFPTLAGAYPGARIATGGEIVAAISAGEGPVAIVSCLPHGVAAGEIRAALSAAESAGRRALVVDTSSDFRHDPEGYARIHGVAHPDAGLLDRFVCALPDVPGPTPEGPVAHPGCFTTSVTLPLWPLAAAGVLRRARVSAITGSSGSGREPSAATHHPERHGNLWAYRPLAHPHQAEMRSLLSRAAGSGIPVDFVPHSGPFVRGIHATIFAELSEPMPADEVAARISTFYARSPFVAVGLSPPPLAHVAGTNRIAIGVAGSGGAGETEVVIASAIDNLGKGAAGGALQWLNRLAGFEPSAGLMAPALGVG